MQTFLPYADYAESASILDRQRLGKQRVETLQILKALHQNVGWIHHPVTKMWAGFECELMLYQSAICDEWRKRGYADTCEIKSLEIHMPHCTHSVVQPLWLGNSDFHLAMRSNLLRKNYFHYIQFDGFVGIPDNLPYLYPKDLS